MSNSNEESTGFGFFDEITEPVDNVKGKPAEDFHQQSEAFGFFSEGDESPEVISDGDQGFGFFSEGDDSPKVTSDEDLGFGFFDTSDQLTSQPIGIDSSTNVINLGADLTIRSVSICKQMIDDNISNGFDVKLAAGDLQKIDTAGLQLLYSLHRTLEKTSQHINWVSSNPIINDTAQFLGMPKLLESSEDEGSFGFF